METIRDFKGDTDIREIPRCLNFFPKVCISLQSKELLKLSAEISHRYLEMILQKKYTEIFCRGKKIMNNQEKNSYVGQITIHAVLAIFRLKQLN